MIDTAEFKIRGALKKPQWFFPLTDIVLVFAAFALAYFVRYELQLIRAVGEGFAAPFEPYLPFAVIYAGWLVLSYRGAGLYRNVRGRSWLDEVYSIINGATNATVVLMAISFIFQPLVFSRLMLVYVTAIVIVLLAGTRAAHRILRAYLRSKGIGIQRVLIVGAGEVGMAVLRTMMVRRELGYQPVGYVDEDPEKGGIDLGRVRGLGGIDAVGTIIRKHHVNIVVITLPWTEHNRILELVAICQKRGVEVRVVPDVFQLNLRQVQVENLDGIPLLGVNSEVTFQPGNRLVKRAIDLALVLLASPVLLIIFAVTALAIRIEGPGPIFYKQRRIGEAGRPFDIIKFRSMIPNADGMHSELMQAAGEDPRHPKLKNDPRVTRVGRIIRKFSLDEMPQFINVVLGHMSLVGPRPPTPDEVALYEPWHRQRLQIMPGITGLWQISGRSDVPFEEGCLLDIYYIENWSIGLDMQILMLTVPRVLLRHGAY